MYAAVIEEVLIVTGKSKRANEDHFDSNVELEMNLREKGKDVLFALVQESKGVRIHFVRQAYLYGLGHAVLQAKSFVVMLGNDLMQDEVSVGEATDQCL